MKSRTDGAGTNWVLNGETITVFIPMTWKKRRSGQKVIIAPDGSDAGGVGGPMCACWSALMQLATATTGPRQAHRRCCFGPLTVGFRSDAAARVGAAIVRALEA